MKELLVIDDNTDYLHILKEALYLSGYSVHTAGDGVQGCELLESNSIDLIISDIRMPRLDGIKVHSFARTIRRYRKTKFIFLSGYKDIYANVVRLDADIDYFLEKTTPVEEIVKLVDKLMFGNFSETWN